MKPIIGITCFCNLGKKNTEEVPYYRVSKNYIESIAKCGGVPLIIPVPLDKILLDDILTIIDGLFITGGRGNTVVGDRSEIKGRPRTLKGLDDNRYIADRYLIRVAMKRNIPFLGICRGMQMICETAGGRLNYEFLDEVDTGEILHRQKVSGNIPTHMIYLEKGSQLQRILGCTEIKVNSFHHQFCAEPGKNFKASAWAKNGIIEAIESPIYRFALGVQFHPEMLINDYPIFIKIFEAFIEESRKYRNNRNTRNYNK
ncbi:MAG TPA: gamma-glutamyl-gamma-aminobutyrate hydrolase family protein [Candidatus Atribacteria bacterium]|nr:gamma-glutamyl-gamma-aminobutyrate hydrolase family protein [Candidatus Atribacteria bacterium]